MQLIDLVKLNRREQISMQIGHHLEMGAIGKSELLKLETLSKRTKICFDILKVYDSVYSSKLPPRPTDMGIKSNISLTIFFMAFSALKHEKN